MIKDNLNLKQHEDFINPLTIISFYEYHLKKSDLLEITPEEHKLKHKKEVLE